MKVMTLLSHSWLARTIGLAVLCSVALAAFAHFRFGSLDVALKTLRGDSLVANVERLSMGRVTEGTVRTLEFRISNRSNAPIRLLGARSSCTCIVGKELPKTIAPGETFPFRVQAGVKSRAGPLDETVRVFTDSDEQPSLAFRISGEVVAVSSSLTSPKEGQP